MEVADARTAVKRLLDISDTTFDDDIDAFVTSGVKRLFPFIQKEIAPASVTSFTTKAGSRVEFDLPTDVEGIRILEAYEGDGYYEHTDFVIHGNKVIVNSAPSNATEYSVYGLGRYTLANLVEELEQAVIYYACSEFFNLLIGNKRKYNVYMSNGRPAVENMQDMADYYDQKANIYLNDRGTIYGG